MSDALQFADSPVTDNVVTPFHWDGQLVRGRVIRLGSELDDILLAHDLPDPVARLLGEAVMAAALAGSSLKMEGRVILQASTDGPVSFLVSDFVSDGGMRGYIRHDESRLSALAAVPQDSELLGKGQFALTIDPGSADKRYQGISAIEPGPFAASIEHYFNASEQVPSRLVLAVSKLTDAEGRQSWRGGGILAQRVAREEEDGDAWNTALALMDTVTADELTDPAITTDQLLYRLFHEQGVRRFDPLPLVKRCTCSRERVAGVLANFSRGERGEMVDDAGKIEMTCEYCARTFSFAPEEIANMGSS